MKKNENRNLSNILFYLLGLILLAIGITLSTKTGLGVSPITSLPFVISSIWGLNFAFVTFITYTIFVGIQFLIKGSNKNWFDLFQIPFSLIFSTFLDIFNRLFTMTYANLWQNIILLLIAVLCTGIGAAMMVKMDFIPNPADGLAKTFGNALGKEMGFSKNIIDFTIVALSCLTSLIFTGEIIGVGLGTLIAMIGVGRTITLFNCFFENQYL